MWASSAALAVTPAARQELERLVRFGKTEERIAPEHALVFCIDEMSQIQALDRTQPGPPMKKGRAGTMTHDDKRHGTTTLFAALDVLKGAFIGRCMPHHRHQEFLKFLKAIDRILRNRSTSTALSTTMRPTKNGKSKIGLQNTGTSTSTSFRHHRPG